MIFSMQIVEHNYYFSKGDSAAGANPQIFKYASHVPSKRPSEILTVSHE